LLTIVVKNVDLMLVVEIDGSDPSIIVNGYGLDATGTFGNLNS